MIEIISSIWETDVEHKGKQMNEKKKKRKIVQIDIEVIPEKESRVSPEKIRTYWRIRISKELTCPSEYQQWWNNHNERGFVYTDQTYSHT